MKICLMVSGQLGRTVLEVLLKSDHDLVGVLTDQRSDRIISACSLTHTPCFIGNPRNGNVSEFIKHIECDLLLSVNYLFIVNEDLIDLPKRYAINIHGSLLPKYKGRTPHVWSIINGEDVTGLTAHIIEKNVDSGPIVDQRTIEIGPDDTGADILNRFHIEYPLMIADILSQMESGELILKPQDDSKSTYFGKRTPLDGRINWNWYRERIRNWIRAQSAPYPGAFTYIDGVKLTIHKSIVSDWGFHQDQENGTILNLTKDNGAIIKTPNGALKISEFEIPDTSILKVGKHLT